MAIAQHFHTKWSNDPAPNAVNLKSDDGTVGPLPSPEPPNYRAPVTTHDDKQSVGTC